MPDREDRLLVGDDRTRFALRNVAIVDFDEADTGFVVGPARSAA